MSLFVATLSVGGLTVGFGIMGAVVGGKVVDYLSASVLRDKSGKVRSCIFIFDRSTSPPTVMSASGEQNEQLAWTKIVISSRFAIVLSLVEVVVMLFVVMVYNFGWFFVLFAVAEFILCCLIAPVNALVMDVVPEEQREFAVGMQIFISHLLGDLPSPIIVGLIRQHLDLRVAMYLLTGWFTWVTLWFWLVDKEYRKSTTSKWNIIRILLVSFFAIFPFALLAILGVIILTTPAATSLSVT